jgi:hypothetical protein
MPPLPRLRIRTSSYSALALPLAAALVAPLWPFACAHDWDGFERTSGTSSAGAQGGDGPSSSSGSSGGGAGGAGDGGGAGSSTTTGPGAGGGGGGGAAPALQPSCRDLLGAEPGTPSGVHTLDADGPGGAEPFEAYCEMSADGGGWTLVLKIDGAQGTFGYTSALWENASLHQPESPDLDTTEAKLASFNVVPFTELRLGMVDGAARWIVVPHAASSLASLMSGGSFGATTAGRAAWKSLLASASLQPNCNQEGFNNSPAGAGQARVRIGIVGNEQSSCVTPDSWIGFGGDGACGDADVGSGNIACYGGDAGDRDTRPFGYVMVR